MTNTRCTIFTSNYAVSNDPYIIILVYSLHKSTILGFVVEIPEAIYNFISELATYSQIFFFWTIIHLLNLLWNNLQASFLGINLIRRQILTDSNSNLSRALTREFEFRGIHPLHWPGIPNDRFLTSTGPDQVFIYIPRTISNNKPTLVGRCLSESLYQWFFKPTEIFARRFLLQSLTE